MVLTLNIIGAGNLGKTIGKILFLNNLVRINSVCNTSEKSSLEAIRFIGSGTYCSSINNLMDADLILIATPDDLIFQVCEKLSKSQNLQSHTTVFHCSGSLTSEILSAVKSRACNIASIHPMRSFANPLLSVKQFSGTYCAMEGDSKSLIILDQLFKALGANTYVIDKSKKTTYHAAGVFASNYLITLSQQALYCLKEAGIPNDISIQVVTNLMRGSINNLEKVQLPELALTGPIQRGDRSTIQNHINALENKTKELYMILGKATIDLTTLSDTQKNELSQLFD